MSDTQPIIPFDRWRQALPDTADRRCEASDFARKVLGWQSRQPKQ